jgi:hypothetical protein
MSTTCESAWSGGYENYVGNEKNGGSLYHEELSGAFYGWYSAGNFPAATSAVPNTISARHPSAYPSSWSSTTGFWHQDIKSSQQGKSRQQRKLPRQGESAGLRYLQNQHFVPMDVVQRCGTTTSRKNTSNDTLGKQFAAAGAKKCRTKCHQKSPSQGETTSIITTSTRNHLSQTSIPTVNIHQMAATTTPTNPAPLPKVTPLQLYTEIEQVMLLCDKEMAARPSITGLQCPYCKTWGKQKLSEDSVKHRENSGNRVRSMWQWEKLSELGKAPQMPYAHCTRWDKCFDEWKQAVSFSFRWVGCLDILKNPLFEALQKIELDKRNLSTNRIGGVGNGEDKEKQVSMMLPQLPSTISCSRRDWLVAVRQLKRSITSLFRECGEINPANQHILNALRSLCSPHCHEWLQRSAVFSSPELRWILDSFSASDKLNCVPDADLIEKVKLVVSRMR